METEKVKIGGMAQPDGIMFKSKQYMVLVRKIDDKRYILNKKICSLANIKAFQMRFLRGLIISLELPYHIASNFYWRFKNRGKFKKKISFKNSIQFLLSFFIFICFLVGFVILNGFIYNWASSFIPIKILTNFSIFIVLIVFSVGLYDIIFGKQLLQYHGAEHKIIYAYMHNKALTVGNVKQSPKENVKCGSSLIMWLLMLLLFMPFQLTWWLVLIYISLAYELTSFASENEGSFLSKIITIPGFIIQLFVTREPSADQIRTGILGFKELLKLEKK